VDQAGVHHQLVWVELVRILLVDASHPTGVLLVLSDIMILDRDLCNTARKLQPQRVGLELLVEHIDHDHAGEQSLEPQQEWFGRDKARVGPL
jgi:hypothetical protein